MEHKLWNVWVQLTTRIDRAFIFGGTDDEAQTLRIWLSNQPHVSAYDLAVEYAEATLLDVREEIAQFIADEVE